MRKFYLSLLLIFLTASLFGQKNGTVKGLAFDTIRKQPFAAATITGLEKKDSSLVTFTMTGNDGRFELKGIPNGDYRLMFTHVNYHNSNIFFTISDNNKNSVYITYFYKKKNIKQNNKTNKIKRSISIAM